jgi:MFS family permease
MSAVLLLALQPFSSYVAAVPFIKEEWGLSNSQAGVVFSIYLVGYALSSLVVVPLTDKFSPMRVMVAGVMVVTLGNLLFPVLAWGFWSGSLLRAVTGAGHVAAYIPGIRLVSERYSGTRRGTAVGVFVGVGYAGVTLSYTFMGLLLSYTEAWRLAYLIMAAASISGMVLILFLAQSGKQVENNGPTMRAGKGRLDLKVLGNKPVLLVILAYALHTAELYLARLWFPLLLGVVWIQQGRAELEAAALAATLAGFMFTTGIIGVFTGGWLSDRLGRSYGAALIFMLSGVCSFVAGWLLGAPPVFLIVLGFFYGFLTAADSAIYSTAITELSPPEQLGSTQAAQSFIGFAIGAVVPVMAGFILDLAQAELKWGFAFSFNGLLALMGVGALVWLRRLPQAVKMAAGKG